MIANGSQHHTDSRERQRAAWASTNGITYCAAAANVAVKPGAFGAPLRGFGA
jgi:hypothetical protein